MKEKELSDLTDEELLLEAKKAKPSAITNALLIGFLIGIIAYSIMVNSVGLFTLIPLFFIYKLVNGPKDTKELERLMKERNLKNPQ
ncbi:FUSC family protein [Arcticibacterium luteifluviistationis]|uniref:FUSC family protein n=1 Tax=Arcticibacterium luteifluviistationis TaxID=1784714 RepID=A0A2Z4G7K0_9BACT|nr:FUSC family protein [Arcticibacterium luteifluviistationis]AWV97154.1 FUSC family protein [Arcticibacterium luteifluviistationis]